jgi:nucleoside-diphosphate-sugar epimerase
VWSVIVNFILIVINKQVTGISGFIGSYIAYHLLQTGYIVRGYVNFELSYCTGAPQFNVSLSTVRKARTESIRKTAGAVYPNLQIVEVDDISGDDLTGVLLGLCCFSEYFYLMTTSVDVSVIIHVASPLAGTGENETILNVRVLSSKSIETVLIILFRCTRPLLMVL